MKDYINQVICGDSLLVLKDFPDNSVDSIVTDPPAGIGFMGKEWDTPNKLEWGKQGEEGKNDLKVKKNFKILPRYQNYDREKFIGWMTEIFTEGLRVLKPGGHALIWALPRTSHWTATALEDAGFEIRDCVYHLFGSGFPKSLDISKAIDKAAGIWRGKAGDILSENDSMSAPNYERTDKGEPITPEAKQWEGWGSALKPAVECWWLCRKPLSENTIAENVLKWSVGGLNIDATRIGSEKRFLAPAGNTGLEATPIMKSNDEYQGHEVNGRFPANLIHDGSDVVLKEFENNEARFFYTAKPSSAEKNLMYGEFEEIAAGGLAGRHDGSLGKTTMAKNFHPTVKAQSLMQYLIKLITPPKGIVLDMFAGSGSTLLAAKTLGHPFIGIERDPEYCKIAEARLKQGVLDF